MPTFYYNKLVRDNIVGWHIKRGHIPDAVELRGVDLKQALKNKLYEEIAELPIQEQADDEVKAELADLQQVLDDLRAEYGVTVKELNQVKRAKKAKKGGFRKGWYVKSVTMPEDDEWTQYCREQPYKYHETAFPTIQKGTYRHNKKGHHYEVLGVSLHTETNQPLVVYRPLHDNEYELFTRPLDMFVEIVELNGEHMPRFEKIDDQEDN